MTKHLTRNQLLDLIDIITKPKGKEFTAGQIDQMLYDFCLNCPDPAGAMQLVVECMDPMTNEELVDRALQMKPRPISDTPTTEMPENHPLRKMTG